MIIKGLKAIEGHMALLRSKQYVWYAYYPDGANAVGDHEEDYVFDALYDVPNT